MSFDSRDPGTANEEWLADPRFEALPPVGLSGFGSVCVIAAHPDDETLGAGGLLATAAALGLAVSIIVVTDGRGDRGVEPARLEAPGGGLAARRAQEVTEAVDLLAPGVTPHLLGFADGSIRDDRDRVTRSLRERLTRAADPGPRLLVATWTGDGHRDHRVLGEIVRELAGSLGSELWHYPIWLWHWAGPASPELPWGDLAVLPLDAAAQRAKHRALESFVSQREPDAEGFPMLHDRFLANFERRFETFVVSRVRPSVAPAP